MYRIGILLIVLMLSAFSATSYARQQGGGDDLQGVCELAGGSWHGTEGGNWACCWADWGCYGCHSGVCKMQCRTKRCRDANRMQKTKSGLKQIKELAPEGAKAPIVPMRRR